MPNKLVISFSPVSFPDDTPLPSEQTILMEGVVEKCIAEINCNGVVQMTTFTESINQVSVRLEEDLHNANDCTGPSQEQQEEDDESYNGGSENRIQEAISDSCVPFISEVLDSMVCQATSSEEQYFSEEQISHLQESIRAEIPSEDENENDGSSENSKGTAFGPCPRNVSHNCEESLPSDDI